MLKYSSNFGIRIIQGRLHPQKILPSLKLTVRPENWPKLQKQGSSPN